MLDSGNMHRLAMARYETLIGIIFDGGRGPQRLGVTYPSHVFLGPPITGEGVLEEENSRAESFEMTPVAYLCKLPDSSSEHGGSICTFER